MDIGDLLIRHKDANLFLIKKCGAVCRKAAQYQPNVTVFVQLIRHKNTNLHLTKHLRLELNIHHKDANLHLTEMRCLRPKSNSISAIFDYRNQSTYLWLGRTLQILHKDVNQKCGASFQKAISQISRYIYFFIENYKYIKGSIGPY